MTLFFLSLSAYFILSLFHLQQSRLGLLFAVIFVVYPTCSASLLYMFTAGYYGFSCFLAVLSVWCMKTGKKLYGCLAIICIAFSLGIYQAYFPVTVTLCLFLVLDYFLDLDSDMRVGLRKGFYYVLSYSKLLDGTVCHMCNSGNMCRSKTEEMVLPHYDSIAYGISSRGCQLN